jgi:hypothetical protein
MIVTFAMYMCTYSTMSVSVVNLFTMVSNGFKKKSHYPKMIMPQASVRNCIPAYKVKIIDII